LNALFTYFVNLCLLRATPQQLPGSNALFGLLFVINALVGTVMMAISGLELIPALTVSLFELVFMLGVLRVALMLYGHPGRYGQSASAIMGSSALVNLMALPLVGIGGQADEGGAMLLLGLIVWSVVVLGHILRHTFDMTPGQGFAVAALYWFVSYFLIVSLFPIN
jgi:hypothetical protein